MRPFAKLPGTLVIIINIIIMLLVSISHRLTSVGVLGAKLKYGQTVGFGNFLAQRV